MNTNTLVTLEGKFCSDPQPGDMIRYYMAPKSLGTVVEKIDKNEVKVLWSNFKNTFDNIVVLWSNFKNPFDNIVRPITWNYTQISQQMFQVQPMPQGAIPFYLDHRFGEKKD